MNGRKGSVTGDGPVAQITAYFETFFVIIISLCNDVDTRVSSRRVIMVCVVVFL